MGLYSISDPYSVRTWYDYSGAYDLHAGVDTMLDQARHIIDSDAYVFQGVAFPKGPDTAVDFGETFSGSINLIPYSYIVSITGFSRNLDQFTLRIYDKGAQTDLYYRQFAWFPAVVSNMQEAINVGEVTILGEQDHPFGPYFFQTPLIVLPPGTLQIQLSNVGATVPPVPPGFVQHVQFLLGVAVPKSTTSLNNRRILTANDPTGTETLQGANLVNTLIGG